MKHSIQKHYQYIHAGEYFSKLLFLHASTQDKNLVHVCSNKEIQKKFSTLAGDLKIPYKKVQNYHDLSRLEYNTGYIYSVEMSFFE